MKKLFGFGVVALAAALVAGNASAQSSDQLKCQNNAAKTIGKFSASKVGCLVKCWAGARKGSAVDCDPAGGRDAATQACITAAEGKSNAGQTKKCAGGACPNCYSGGNCTANAAAKTTAFENLVDLNDNGGPGTVHCSGATQTKEVGACQDNTAKVIVKFGGSLSKCTQKCKANEAKGSAAPGSCDPPASDPATQACISAAVGKCGPAVEKKCATKPTCWAPPFNTGTGWCNLVKGIVDSNYSSFYCGSPSGAFLE